MPDILDTLIHSTRSFAQIEDEATGKGIHILTAFLLAGLIHLFAWRMAGRIVRLSRFQPQERRPSAKRQQTMRSLIANAISFVAFGMALLVTAGQFVSADTLVWSIGLFSAAFGLGARPLIADFLTGISFIFEDTFAVDEKVEMIVPGTTVEGTIESVNLRTTLVRSPTGELYIVPNGEVRVLRNFSRGQFSVASVTLKVPASQFKQTLELLEHLAPIAVERLPNLIEPWQVISETGVIGQQSELTLVAKAKFGKAAEMRPRLLALLQEHLSDAGIELTG